MKYKNIILGLTVVAASLSSCKDFLDVNDDPNAPTKENINLIEAKLSGALVSSAIYENKSLNEIGGYWGGYWGNSNEGINTVSPLKTYNGPAIRDSRDGLPVWESTFNNLIYYQGIIEQAETEEEDADFYSGAAKIMMAYHYFILVDFYNNVPFNQSLQADNYLQPTYNSGQEVYTQSINLITEGISEIKNATRLPSDYDVLFKGNKQNWIKFGNTLKLRALLRQSEISAQTSYITQEISKVINEGSGFLNEDAKINPGYLNTTDKMNPFYATFYRGANGRPVSAYNLIRPTKYLIDIYKEFNDPRLEQNYVAIEEEFNGVVFGNNAIANEYSAARTSPFKGPSENGNKPAGTLKSFDQGAMMLSLAESFFLQAEAAERGWISENSITLYNKGIQASFDYLFNTNNYNISSYIMQQNVDLEQATNKIERIITQKWLALNGVNNIQAWHDQRRLGYPDFPNSITSPTPGAYPKRFMYPESELNTNNKNATSQGDVGVLT